MLYFRSIHSDISHHRLQYAAERAEKRHEKADPKASGRASPAEASKGPEPRRREERREGGAARPATTSQMLVVRCWTRALPTCLSGACVCLS